MAQDLDLVIVKQKVQYLVFRTVRARVQVFGAQYVGKFDQLFCLVFMIPPPLF